MNIITYLRGKRKWKITVRMILLVWCEVSNKTTPMNIANNYVTGCNWILENWPNRQTRIISFLWITTFVHYLCTVLLQNLVNWSAFLKQILPTLWSHSWAHRGHQVAGICKHSAWSWPQCQWDISYTPLTFLGLY